MKAIGQGCAGSQGIKFQSPVEIKGIGERQVPPGLVHPRAKRKGAIFFELKIKPEPCTYSDPLRSVGEVALIGVYPVQMGFGLDHKSDQAVRLLGRKGASTKQGYQENGKLLRFHGACKIFSIFNVSIAVLVLFQTMNHIENNTFVKIGIIVGIALLILPGCRPEGRSARDTVVRFEEMLSRVPADRIGDSIRGNHPDLVTFFGIYNEQIIRIGPDTMALYPELLSKFLDDPMIVTIYDRIRKNNSVYQKAMRETEAALANLPAVMPGAVVPRLITFISGFNQAFITLPNVLAIGLDNYLGDTCTLYPRLGIPAYISKQMIPENIPADAVRAWLSSEMAALPPGSSFLDNLVHQGIIYYCTEAILKDLPVGRLFHYTDEQVRWCRDNEKAMWKFLAQEELIFSTDRFTVRRFFEEAPFTREFGQDSPGRTGAWIGYRLVSSYAKETGCSMNELLLSTDYRKILSRSNYHP